MNMRPHHVVVVVVVVEEDNKQGQGYKDCKDIRKDNWFEIRLFTRSLGG